MFMDIIKIASEYSDPLVLGSPSCFTHQKAIWYQAVVFRLRQNNLIVALIVPTSLHGFLGNKIEIVYDQVEPMDSPMNKGCFNLLFRE